MTQPRPTTVDMRTRSGFTVAELLVVLVLLAIAGAMAWTLAQVGASSYQRELRRADAERTRRNVEAIVGRALEQSASAGLSAHNAGMLRVRPVTIGSGTAADTLLLLRSTGAALPVASRPCRVASASTCIALRGDRAADVRAGDVLAVGSSRVGYRFLQITSIDGPYTAPCGADCPSATFCALTAAPPVAIVEVLMGTTSSGVAAGPACRESVYPDGTRCHETRVTRTTAPRPRSSCRAVGPSATFTDLRGSDRTLTLGFPQPQEWSAVSAGGATAIAAVPVEPFRVHAAPEGSALALHGSRGLGSGGRWNPARRLAGPIAYFRVESQHAGSAEWVRGDGVSAATLAQVPNRTASAVPGPGEAGFVYLRGYHTIVAVRLEVAPVANAADGSPAAVPLRILQSFAPLARGGAREEP